MNASERIKMIKAMEFICRNLNDPCDVEKWVAYGVSGGDIEYGDLRVRDMDADILKYYLTDENFSRLMGTFLYIMHHTCEDVGLYCDNVLSNG